MAVKTRVFYYSFVFLWIFTGLSQELQGVCYDVFPIPYEALPTTPPVGSTTLTFADDSYSDIIDIGFTFNFFDNNYTQLVIGSNGNLSFDLSLANQEDPYLIFSPIPNPFNPVNAIMFPWQDLDPRQGGTIFYYTTGIAPHRQFVVVFNEVGAYGTDCTVTQGVILYENTNTIDMIIGSKTCFDSINNGNAIEGIQNASGTIAFAVPGRNAVQWFATNDSYRFAPTPPQPNAIFGATTVCAGSSQIYSISPILNATSYIWSVPTDWIITQDRGTSIVATVGASGVVSVTAANFCGNSDPQVLSISVDTVPGSGVITGPSEVTLGQIATYSVPFVNNASYHWSYSGSEVELTPLNNQIALSFGSDATEGLLAVSVSNFCGTSLSSTLFISIEMLPPSSIKAKKLVNEFATQTEYINEIKWTASPSPGVDLYRIYRNGKLIDEVPGFQHTFKDHNRPKNQRNVYSVTAVGTNGQESLPVSISIR